MYALEMKDITKEFPGVKALKNVSFSVKKGEIHALCGENGAGKSTLMKVLSGLHSFGTYTGDIIVNDALCEFKQIKDAENTGIAIIHQELAMVKDMTIGENIFLGREPRKLFGINYDQLYYNTKKWLKEVGLHVNPDAFVSTLGIGQQQLIEIAKALSKDAKILILDEPTAALTESEVKTLMDILFSLRNQGVTCIYISHKLNEVFQIADQITVLRDGQAVKTFATNETTEDEIITVMVGRELTERYPRVQHYPTNVVLDVKSYSVIDEHSPNKSIIKNVSFHVKKGEIVGIAGLMGAGRSELVMSLFGAYGGKATGDVYIDNKKIIINSVSQAISHGIALVTEDRKRLGLILGMDIKENTTLASLDKISFMGKLNKNEEIKYSQKYVNDLKTKTPHLETKVSTLSGGNQQKVVLAKWLMANPKLLILDEPTRGIDVGAKFEIYHLMNELVEKGVSILMISSELPEILGMSDRVYVMREGEIVKEFHHNEATQERIMLAATGGK